MVHPKEQTVKELQKIINKNEKFKSLLDIAKEINIGVMALRTFLIDPLVSHQTTFIKIQRYVELEMMKEKNT